MRRNLAAFAVSMLWACACGEGLAQPTSTIIDDRAEIEEHLLSPRPVARTDWKEEPSLSAQAEGGAWGARIIVDEAGAVSAVRIVWGRRENRAEAEAAARALRFTPFEREGRAVRAEFSYYIEALPQDYSGPLDRTFPEDDDLSDIRIRLVRTGCYGSCPDYEIEIAGDGSVVYRGGAFALIRGEHRWRIPQTSVLELIQYFRGADYFNLRGHYRIRATHLPTYITALQIGRRRKFVLNYGRFIVGAISSTVFASTDDQMLAPLAVVEIESAIDRLSGTDAWVRGSEKTVAALRAEGWNFRSREGGRAVAHLTIDCNLALAGGFMAEGARVTERIDEGWLNGKTAIAAAPRCGDIAFVRELIRRGAVRNRAVARSFLWASAASGRPGMVAEALRHSRAVNQRTSDGETLLMAAVGALTPDEGDPRAGEHDIAATVGLLLAAGANARVRNDEG
jgi:hypothetical protein